MAKTQWSTDYTIGVRVVDDQHKFLFALIADLQKNRDASSIARLLQELEDYAGKHFRDEEMIMEKSGYPGFEKHQLEHEGFMAWLGAERREWQESGDIQDDVVNARTVKFLENWLIQHILIEDMAYRDHLKKCPPKEFFRNVAAYFDDQALYLDNFLPH